jgi:GNAT superfamily N-acetyltransferase
MRFTEYDADDAELLEAARVIVNAFQAAETPWLPQLTAHRWAMQVRHGWDGSLERHLLAWADGVPVGVAALELGEWDNLDLAWIDLCVHPEQRRRGHGSALLAHLLELAREAGRTKVGLSGWELPATVAFARHHGFKRAAEEIYRVVRPRELARGFVDDAYTEAAAFAEDYELLRFVGQTPDELLVAVSEMTVAINDAPIDDLDVEDEAFPAERIRSYEDATINSGHRLYRVIARHRESGELAGHTVVAVDAETPEIAHQHDTAVVRAHRGHRLGLLVKADLMRWLAVVEPQVEMIDTWNAESNKNMIEVNERLGYCRVSRELEFQKRL